MDTGAVLRRCRVASGQTQRDLAAATGVPQPAIARIESGGVVPRVDTFERLLSGCGRSLQAIERRGQGVDRSVIRALLELTPRQRLELATEEAKNIEAFERALVR